MKKIILYIVDNLVFGKILPPILLIYEKRIMYRIRKAWGTANLYKIKEIGENVSLVGYTRVLNGENISIGSNVRIGYGCFLFGKGGIRIDDNTIISRNVVIYSGNHNYDSKYVPFNNEYVEKEVLIGKGVWIGMGVFITPGVKIGDGSIIGMGTVVSKDVEPGEIVVGSGQRIVGKRDLESFYLNMDKGNIFSKIWPEN